MFKEILGANLKDTSKLLLSLNKNSLRKIIFAITGLWPLGRHTRRIGIQGSLDCPGCGLNSMETDCIHFWCLCPALCRLRLKIFGMYSVDSGEQLINIPISKEVEFILSRGGSRG